MIKLSSKASFIQSRARLDVSVRSITGEVIEAFGRLASTCLDADDDDDDDGDDDDDDDDDDVDDHRKWICSNSSLSTNQSLILDRATQNETTTGFSVDHF